MTTHHTPPKLMLIGRWLIVALIFLAPSILLRVVEDTVRSALIESAQGWVFGICDVIAWTAGTLLVFRLAGAVVWDLYFEKRRGIPIPKLLRVVAGVVIFVASYLLMLGGHFEQDLTGLLAATGAASLVLGFALKSTIADIFAGLSLNIERPFQLGDVIEVQGYGAGYVRDINWRSTRIETWDRELVIIPNEVLTTSVFKNLSRPDEALRMNLYFHIDHAVPTDRVLRILQASVDQIDIKVPGKSCETHIHDIDEIGIKYRVWVWAVNYDLTPNILTDAIAIIIRNLYQAGIRPVYRKLDIFTAEMPKRDLNETDDLARILSRVETFAALNDEELETLAKSVSRRLIKKGAHVVEQDAQGDSLFVVLEGLLAVRVWRKSSRGLVEENVVAQLSGGNSFGEMSLLTGEPRSATVTALTDCVVYEITREHIAPLLQERPEIMESLSKEIAARRIAADAALSSLDAAKKNEQQSELEGNMYKRMTRFFRSVGTAVLRK